MVLLLHGNGLNGGTTFTDSSASAKTVTPAGDASTSTSSPKFGSAAILLGGSADYLSCADSTDWDFSTGDFTIDCWIKLTATSGDYAICSRGTNQFFLAFTGGNAIWASINDAQSSTFAVTLDTTTWHHVAWTRASGTNRIFYDGVKVGEWSNAGDINEATAFEIGRRTNGSWDFPGRIDEFRVSKGIARWTANFTPPTAEYV